MCAHTQTLKINEISKRYMIEIKSHKSVVLLYMDCEQPKTKFKKQLPL